MEDNYIMLIDAAVDGLANEKNVVDDILLSAKGFKEHVGQVHRLLQRFRDHDISIRYLQFNYAKPDVKCVGYIVKFVESSCPNESQGISKLTAPENLVELRSFMGLVNHMGRH